MKGLDPQASDPSCLSLVHAKGSEAKEFTTHQEQLDWKYKACLEENVELKNSVAVIAGHNDALQDENQFENQYLKKKNAELEHLVRSLMGIGGEAASSCGFPNKQLSAPGGMLLGLLGPVRFGLCGLCLGKVLRSALLLVVKSFSAVLHMARRSLSLFALCSGHFWSCGVREQQQAKEFIEAQREGDQGGGGCCGALRVAPIARHGPWLS